MNISLTPQLETFIRAKLESGLYNNNSEVIREALRLMKREDDREQEKLNALRAEIAKGDASFAKGDFHEVENMDDLNRLIDE